MYSYKFKPTDKAIRVGFVYIFARGSLFPISNNPYLCPFPSLGTFQSSSCQPLARMVCSMRCVAREVRLEAEAVEEEEAPAPVPARRLGVLVGEQREGAEAPAHAPAPESAPMAETAAM
jgi:hypothetical protein